MSDMYNLLEQLCHEKGVNITQMSRETKIPRSNNIARTILEIVIFVGKLIFFII